MYNAPLGWMSNQESIKALYLDSYSFLFYTNDLLDNLISNPNLFADNASLFSTVADPNATAN